MNVKFWGTRGSVASGITNEELLSKIKTILRKASAEDITDEASIEEFIDTLPFLDKKTLGGNTSCVRVQFGDTFIIFDAGSGLRLLGDDLIENYGLNIPFKMHIFLSHFHWDHIQGFPFFKPAFIPGNNISFYSAIDNARDLLSRQQETSFFPVKFEDFGADIDFVTIDTDTTFTIDNVTVDCLELVHPGTSTGFRVSDGSATLVYMSDTELVSLDEPHLDRYRAFISGADAVIVDAQYDFEESHEKKHWGHSSPFMFIDVLKGTDVKRVFLFHHDPGNSDEDIYKLHSRAKDYKQINCPDDPFDVMVAIEGEEYNF